MAPTSYTLTRIAHPTHNPALLETYIDAESGEQFTGGYLRHTVGESEAVSPYIARVVMTDAGLKQHYTCQPPFGIDPPAAEKPVTFSERHTSVLGDPE